MIHVNHKAHKLALPYRGDVAALFPHARPLEVQGHKLLALDHGTPETILLRRMGLDVPAPVLTRYDWCGGTPFDVQRKTAAMLTTEKRGYVLNSMGTGKTRSALWAYDFLRSEGTAKRMLVVSPLSTLRSVWESEAFRFFPNLSVGVLHGTKAQRLHVLREPHDIYVINHDGVGTILDELSKRDDIDVLLIDELAVYRNGSAERTKKLRKLAAKKVWVWGMTGSPIPNGPPGAWGQCSIVTPHTVPNTSGTFATKYSARWGRSSGRTGRTHSMSCMRPCSPPCGSRSMT